MQKTPVQEKLEAQRGKDIQEIFIELLEKYKGRRHIPQSVASELGVSYATFYEWCKQFGIDPKKYRFPNEAHS